MLRKIVIASLGVLLTCINVGAFTASDPGVRGGIADAGGPITGLTTDETTFFNAATTRFTQVETVPNGLGPRFNGNSCAMCHIQPTLGGTSPFDNPQIALATLNGATNTVPFFTLPNGPIREARFPNTANGKVQDIFTMTGRTDAGACNIAQPDFVTAFNKHNLIFRIPTPLFGAGLIENIPDTAIIANMTAYQNIKARYGISGHPNISGNDGTITRFGWKAQNKSLLMFSGEAYNVEMGVTNELFPQERDETPGCVLNPLPEDHTNFSGLASFTDVPADVVMFAIFMRELAPPTPAPDTPSVVAGRQLFGKIGCTLCHNPTFTTSTTTINALSNQKVNLFSDLLLHNMGEKLEDNILQGNAGPGDFRTAPLWGLGQRIFFLHDGRTTDLKVAILDHASDGSEANHVIDNFTELTEPQKQALFDFLRSL